MPPKYHYRGRGGRHFDFRDKSIRKIIYKNLLDIPGTMIHFVLKVPQCVIKPDYRKCYGFNNAPSTESQIILYFVYIL